MRPRRILTSEAASHVGGRVHLKGWVSRVRVLGGIAFFELRDRAGSVQVVARKGSPCFDTARRLGRDYVVAVEGEARREERAPGGVEIVASHVAVLNEAEKPLPLDYTRSGNPLNLRLDWRFLDLRNPRSQAALKALAEAAHAARQYFRSKGFLEIFTPKIIGQASEGGADVFPLVYFGREAFLAQSPQLYKQLMMATGVERVFEIGVAFRAEEHRGPRHLCEFRSIDYEVSFVGDHVEVARYAVEVVRRAAEAVVRGVEGFEHMFGEPPVIPGNPPILTVEEACRLIGRPGCTMSAGEEELLGNAVAREYGSDLVVVTEYPWGDRPFYTMKLPEDPSKTRSFDVILRGLEVASGGQREHRYEILVQQLREKGLDPSGFRFYLDHFKYGMPPHGGAGVGLERLVKQILGLRNIREATLVPRDPERLVP